LFDALDGNPDYALAEVELLHDGVKVHGVEETGKYRAAFEKLLAAAVTGEQLRALLSGLVV
jgi:hypothetical protein